MADVAREAGVATSTVSRALADPGRVNVETRDRIVAAAKRLGYTLNAAARNLRTRSSRAIMMVLPGARYHIGASQVVPKVMRAIDATLLEYGYGLLMGNFDRSESADRRIIDLACGGAVDGVIMLASPVVRANGRSLLDCGLPLTSVFFDRCNEGIPSIVTNDRAAMREAAQHLIDLGHRRFFYLAGPPGNYHEVERFTGLCEALTAAGLGSSAVIRSDGDFDFASGIAGARHFLPLVPRPTAVLCCNDNMALSFMKIVTDAGLSVPRDVSVVGFDGAEVGAYCGPGLTTVQQPTDRMGRQAAVRILRMIAHRSSKGGGSRARKPTVHVEDSTLVIRGSTGPAPS